MRSTLRGLNPPRARHRLAAALLLGTALGAGASTAHAAPTRTIDYAFYLVKNQVCDQMGRPVELKEIVALSLDGIAFVNSMPDTVWLSVQDADPAAKVLGTECIPIPPTGRRHLVIPARAAKGAEVSLQIYDRPCPGTRDGVGQMSKSIPVVPILNAPSIKIGDGP